MKNPKTVPMTFPKSLILLVIGLTYFTGLHAAPEDVDLTGANPNPEFEFNFGMGVIPAATDFGVLNATGDVFWEFASIPVGASGITSTTFTFNGITVTIPNSAGGAVSNALTATIEGTPVTAGSFTFTVTVSDESDPASRTRNRPYDIIFTPDADLVLVLDRSGSMSINTSEGISRWEALKNATENFMLILTGLGRTGDNIGLTYFHSTVTQPSGATFPTPLIPVVANTGTQISGELDTQSPSGGTAMGAGLKDGQGKITDNSRVRFLVLFTDGDQNVPPLANSNGQGYSDGSPLNSSYPAGPGSIKVFTIGIASPNGPDLNTLQNLANANRGHYVGTDDGTLSEAFEDQLFNAFGSLSPQLITRSSTLLSSSDEFTDLQSFPLNKKVSRLLIKISADRKFEVPQLIQFASSIVLEKDGVPVQGGVQPSWVGNYSNTVLLTIPFDNTLQNGGPATSPEGEWSIRIRNTESLDISDVQVTSIADDHRLDYTYSYGATSPRVNTQLSPSLTLSWLGDPVTDASVQAVVLRPGEDLGDVLAKNPLIVKVTTDPDAPSAGVQKYNQLYATDSAFKNSLAYNENVITLNHTADGKYEGTFDGLTVAGNYQIVYRISGDNAKIGKYQRSITESIFVSFDGVDLDASNLSTTMLDNSMILTITPVTFNNKLVGPAYGKGFTIDNPNVKIDAVEDHQDGSYTITFSGNIDENVSFELMGQEIYKGNLDNIGGKDSIIDKIQDWLESIGLPGWTLWLIILILLVLLVIRFASKKK
jgi:hypothetical protein